MKTKMKALGSFCSDGVGAVSEGQEFECDAQRAAYLEGIGMAVKMADKPKNKMARALKNKGAK